jgi:hypothetical protein
MITRTDAQALARARGIWGPRKAWVEGPSRKQLAAMARETLASVLDGLTLVARCPDLVHTEAVQTAARKLVHPWALFTGPFRVGKVDDYGFGRIIEGQGWSWDEAFAEAERKLADKAS